MNDNGKQFDLQQHSVDCSIDISRDSRLDTKSYGSNYDLDEEAPGEYPLFEDVIRRLIFELLERRSRKHPYCHKNVTLIPANGGNS
jgi:hypothetical protein